MSSQEHPIYLLTRNEIEDIVKVVISEAYSGDHLDMPVLWLKIDSIIEGNETVL